jgi:superfamily I DNA and/or RNA helicase
MQDIKQVSNLVCFQNYDSIPLDLIYQKKKPNSLFDKTTFVDRKNYSKHQVSLIEEEIETIESENELPPILNVPLEFDYRENNQCIIKIENPKFKIFEKNTVEIYKKNELIIKGAKVSKLNDSAILYCHNLPKMYPNGEYEIQLTESISNYERMKVHLERFGKKILMNPNIIDMILGYVQDYNVNIRNPKVKQIFMIPKIVEEGIKINSAQENAIKNALMYYLSIVIGTPGSGKTFLLINLVYNIRIIKGSTEKILICAQTNQAIDNIIKFLKKYNFEKYVRVLSPAKELSEELDLTNSVHKLAREKIYNNQNKYSELIKLIERKEKNGYLCEKDFKIYKERIRAIENEIIESADIVLSTLNNSADDRLRDIHFSYVIIDEAAQALEPDIILSLVHQAQMVVLIGDDKQLGPLVHSKEAAAAGLSRSMFERLHTIYKDAPFITLLNEQYRMNERLNEFPNKKFYEGKMTTSKKILPDPNIPWLNKDFPSVFCNVPGKEELENKSRYNNDEVLYVYIYVNILIGIGVEAKKIGVLTFYSAQKQRFYEKFNTKEKYQDLKIDTVDGFQGMEMDYIIISTVRANPDGELGFLKSEKRLNVALTRARKGLIIIGDAKCLAKRRGIFRDLVLFYCSKGLIANHPFDQRKKILKIDEIIEKEDLYNDEEEYDEMEGELNEMRFCFRKVKKIKNEKPAPVAGVNQQIIPNNNQNYEQKKQVKNNNKNKKKGEKKVEIKVEVKPIKHKKKKKNQNMEENDEDEKEEEDLKKKGNKKWKTKNLYNKKKKKQEQQEDKKEDQKVEEEPDDEQNNSSKKRGKKQKKEKNEKDGKKNKNKKK